MIEQTLNKMAEIKRGKTWPIVCNSIQVGDIENASASLN